MAIDVIWQPHQGPQTWFCQSSAYELLYGGAAGGGKSDGLLGEATRQVGNPEYRGVLFRRTFPELERAGGLIDRSQIIYPALEGAYSLGKRRWTFPSGASVEFGHMQRDADRYQYQGSQFQYLGFDELTHFTEKQYTYLFSRCRTTMETGLRCYVRSGTNPGGVGHEWVKQRWAAWLDSQHPNPARAGELRWYARIDGVDTEVEADHPDAKSRTFIPARVEDNPSLAGTDYEKTLRALSLIDRRRLLDGDWDIMPGRGLVFQRAWFDVVEAMPAVAKRVRFWDLAATAKKATGDDPDYTVGARVAKAGGTCYIEHLVRVRANWGEVKRLIRQTAEADGVEVEVGLEQEPGASGKALIVELVEQLAGFTVRGQPAQGDKLVRAGPWSAQAEVGNVKLVNGAWVQAFLDECEWFPEGAHDDQVDAVSGAYQMLIGRKSYTKPGFVPYV